MAITDWPVQERPREKLLQRGAATLSDAEPERWDVFERGARMADFIGCLPEADDTVDYPDNIGFEEHCVRMIDLARLYVHGEIDEGWLTDAATTDDECFKFLLTLPGVGPYAAGNIMQLLGRYSRLALDSESVRHGKTVLGMTGTDANILKKMARHYEPFGDHRFQSYWFELWAWYESKKGKSWTWRKKETASAFTASKLK